MKNTITSFKLNEATCDEIAGLIICFCESIGIKRKDAVRYRVSAEECLLYWLENGLEGSEVSLQMGRFMLSPFITLEVHGKGLNPYSEDDDDYGVYGKSVLVSLGLSPEYSYVGGRNRIRFRIKKKSLSQLEVLCMVLGAAVFIGVLGTMLIPADIREIILKNIVNPISNTFFKVLGCIAGPMVLISVVEGVTGIGDSETFGRIGRGMMIRYTLIVLASAAAASIFFPLLGPKISGAGEKGDQLGTITELLLGIFPSNIVEPFTSGNTLQVIFMGIVVGIALLYLGRQTASLTDMINQINILVQFLMQFISKIVPCVIFLIVINLIWSGGFSILLTAWELFAVALLAIVLLSVVFVAFTSLKMKVSPVLLVKKSLPTFLIALTTASSAAAFSSNVETCEKKFGIEPSFIKFGIPLGMVIHKPVTAVYNLMLVFYFARQYNVSCSLSWIFIAAFVCAIVAIAMPPIPGGGAVGYSILFLQMGIPSDALAIALAMDIITDFFVTAFEMFALPLSLINISSKMGTINPEVLRKN